jgi:hypothetical protein
MVSPFHLDGVWTSLSRFTYSISNHKLVNKNWLNTMAISVERTHFERGSCLEALMFHCRWHPQEHHAIKYNTQFTCTCPILLCVIFFEGFFLNVFSVFTCGCGCGYVFLLNGCLCFFILGWIIIFLLMDNNYFL